MKLNTTALKKLELKPTDLYNLPEEEQYKLIRRQWHRLSLKHHPDKNTANPLALQRFQGITEAHEILKKELMGDHSNYRPEINDHFIQTIVDIPDTAFDLLLQEGIEAAYNDLLKTFVTLTTTSEKTEFAAFYADFLNVAQSLEKRQEEFNACRVDYLRKKEDAPFLKRFLHEYNLLILRLFAEEYLDDFQYRQALASGELMPILAIEKLLSPVKGLVAVLNGINLMIRMAVLNAVESLLKPLILDFVRNYADYEQSRLDLKKAGILALKIMALLVAITVPFYFALIPTMCAFSLPMIAKVLECIACPVNTIIRPLASYTGLSPLALSALFAALGASTIYALAATTACSGFMLALPFLSLALTLYCFYGIGTLLYKIYQLSPALFLFQTILFIGSILLGFLIPPIDANQSFDVLVEFFYLLSSSASIYITNQLLDNPNMEAAETIMSLPLPKEPVPEALQHAVLRGYKTATQSARLFNTSEHAEYLTKEERTFWQKTNSFFGGGAKNARHDVPVSERTSMLNITCA